MKAHLLYKDRDFNVNKKFPQNAETLNKDLDLDTLFEAMSLKNGFLSIVASQVIHNSLKDLDEIYYRQNILRDCLKNTSVVRELYGLAVEVNENREYHFGLFMDYPSSILYNSIELMQKLVVMLKKIKNISDKYADKFESEGFITFFAMLQKELDDEYFENIQAHLREMQFRNGTLMSANLGKGFIGINYILRKPHDVRKNIFQRILSKKPLTYTFYIGSMDESGLKALSRLNDMGLNPAANALAQSCEHIMSFFGMLRLELGFYVGCLNLYEKLMQKGEPVCFPLPVPSDERRHNFIGLYDVCLALKTEQKVIGNDVNADGRDLVIITGANQGGKSTFLRSVGQAQLMMQCGMFVPAEYFSANIRENLFTHFKREEDTSMVSGKLDEEMSRMSDIADMLTTGSFILFNESFAATNEREGSEIARQIVSAIIDKGAKVFFVTHLYDFAHSFYDKSMQNSMFLRAERNADGSRPFKLIEGEPLQTSYGEDLYNEIFLSY